MWGALSNERTAAAGPRQRILGSESRGTHDHILLSSWPMSKVKVTLRLTVSQSVSLGVEPHLGLMTRYLLLFDNYGLVSVGRPL
jgi:hypothetical protein